MASRAPAPGGHVVRRPHMPMSERAKIFIPFDPLPGYRQMLREREEELLNVPRVDLSGEQRERLSRQIRELEAKNRFLEDCLMEMSEIVYQ